ncbi:ThuA domain-containing protein [Microbacterium oleivorans]|uniref:ThuA domain-containing protein n=1 Tax=Microbacterium oleivorans TaxID=273677 RepID=UPI00203A472F|nr:ThuA domain-containing protein [Microbacterium oleivorans]MCM3695433.1 ThuA domain-containing protein [Microbacterium oleivorans]
MTVRTVILSGTERYADPWHPFAETSACVAAILRGIGHDVTVREDVDAAMASLADADLVVVNAGDSWRGGERGVDAAAVAAFDAALDRGVGVLALHCAVASLRDYPRWAGMTGAVWLPTLSFHPPFGRVVVDVEGAVPFTVEDERYCALQATGDRRVVAWHEGDGGHREPTAWRRTVGRSRVAVDVLGHDARSYDAPGHAALVAELATWAAATS